MHLCRRTNNKFTFILFHRQKFNTFDSYIFVRFSYNENSSTKNKWKSKMEVKIKCFPMDIFFSCYRFCVICDFHPLRMVVSHCLDFAFRVIPKHIKEQNSRRRKKKLHPNIRCLSSQVFDKMHNRTVNWLFILWKFNSLVK